MYDRWKQQPTTNREHGQEMPLILERAEEGLYQGEEWQHLPEMPEN
jgi:hypothetical protein